MKNFLTKMWVLLVCLFTQNEKFIIEHYGLDDLLAEAEAGLPSEFSAFEAEMFEVENALIRKGMPSAQARKIALNKVLPKIATASKTGVYGGKMANLDLGERVAAQFDVIVTQTNVAVGGGAPPSLDVPIVLFAALEQETAYLDVLARYPVIGTAGFATTLVYTQVGRNAVFTCTQVSGGDSRTQTYTVQTNEVPYINLVKATNSRRFKISKMRISVNDVVDIDQFSKTFKLYGRTLFGKSSDDTISVKSNQDPKNFIQTIIDVDGEFAIDQTKGFVNFVKGKAALVTTYSMFIEQL